MVYPVKNRICDVGVVRVKQILHCMGFMNLLGTTRACLLIYEFDDKDENNDDDVDGADVGGCDGSSDSGSGSGGDGVYYDDDSDVDDDNDDECDDLVATQVAHKSADNRIKMSVGLTL